MSKQPPSESRRRFIKSSLIAGVALAAPTIIPGRAFGQDAPSNRITLGFIGCGKQGTYLLRGFLRERGTQVVALCDVDKLKLQRGLSIAQDYYAKHPGGGKGIHATGDFRELLARDDIDAVVVSTPDHWHGLAVIRSAEAGKDIYCEKPLAHNIDEGKAMVAAVRRNNRVFQTGSMQRSDSKFRHACELVQNGYIGDIKHVAVNVGGPPAPCALPAMPVPDYLDWERWLGPAPWRPYNAELSPHITNDVFPNWRGYRDFGGGGMTDWGAHHFDIAQWGLGMDGRGPVKVIPPDGREFKDLTYIYENGVVMSRSSEWDGMPVNGILFVGDKGKVMVNRGFIKTWPERLIKQNFGPNEIHLYKSENHYADFLNAVRSRKKPICDIAVGSLSTMIMQTSCLADPCAVSGEFKQPDRSENNDYTRENKYADF